MLLLKCFAKDHDLLVSKCKSAKNNHINGFRKLKLNKQAEDASNIKSSQLCSCCLFLFLFNMQLTDTLLPPC